MDSDISKQRTNCIFFNVINYDVAHLWQLIVTSLITNKMTFCAQVCLLSLIRLILSLILKIVSNCK